jgi:hypothetical protein
LPPLITIGCTTTISPSYASHINNEKIDDMGKNSFFFVIVAKVRLAELFLVGEGGSCYVVITIPKTLTIDIGRNRQRKR